MRWTNARSLIHFYEPFQKVIEHSAGRVRLFISSRMDMYVSKVLVNVSRVDIQVEDTYADVYDYVYKEVRQGDRQPPERQRARTRCQRCALPQTLSSSLSNSLFVATVILSTFSVCSARRL